MKQRKLGCMGVFSIMLVFVISLLFFFNIVDFIPDNPDQWFSYVDDLIVVVIFLGTLVYVWFVADINLKKSLKVLVAFVVSTFALVIGAVYLLSPIDIVPDAIPFLGWLDDVIIGLGLFIYLMLKPWVWALADTHKEEISAVESLPFWKRPFIHSDRALPKDDDHKL